MEVEAKIDLLVPHGLHEILFRNAGVALKFYEGPYPIPDDWKRYLRVYHYYDSLSLAVDAECERLEVGVVDASRSS